MTDQSVTLIVKAHAARVGLDPSQFSGHSLRAGFLTSAAKRGASIFKMMDVSRHRSVDTLRGYVRDAEIFKDHARRRLAVGSVKAIVPIGMLSPPPMSAAGVVSRRRESVMLYER
jgi:integrase